MKRIYRSLSALVGVAVVAFLLIPNANAICGVNRPAPTHASWDPHVGQAHLVQAAFEDERGDGREPIVGFWHVKFVTKGDNQKPSMPNNTEIDAGYSIWHSDNTEIMNSGGRSPITGDFCLGVWKKVGECEYKLNHFAAGWDPTGSSLVGPANIKEDVIVSHDGNEFTGTFSIDQYTEAGNNVAHFQGQITGTRITVTTPPTSVF
jgi:hypothetical protein